MGIAGTLALLDSLLHRLHVPMFLWRPLCDAYEKRLLISMLLNDTDLPDHGPYQA